MAQQTFFRYTLAYALSTSKFPVTHSFHVAQCLDARANLRNMPQFVTGETKANFVIPVRRRPQKQSS